MTLAELGIDEATWAKALANAGLWKPGQQCERSGSKSGYEWDGSVLRCGDCDAPIGIERFEFVIDHDIPMPEPTDALLMAMLVALGKYEVRLGVETRKGVFGWECRIWPCDAKFDGTEVWAEALASAIIRATASLT